MQIEATTFPVHEPNQNLLHRAYFAEQICLVLAIQIVLINLLSRIFGVLANLLPAGMQHMGIFSTLAVLSAQPWLCSSRKGSATRAFIVPERLLPALRH